MLAKTIQMQKMHQYSFVCICTSTSKVETQLQYGIKWNNQTNTFCQNHMYYWSVLDIKIFDITSATWWNCTPKQCPPNFFISHLNKNYNFFSQFWVKIWNPYPQKWYLTCLHCIATIILGKIVRFCFLALKMLPPCGENAQCNISVTARPISKILFLLFWVKYCFLFKNKRMYFQNMGYTLTWNVMEWPPSLWRYI